MVLAPGTNTSESIDRISSADEQKVKEHIPRLIKPETLCEIDL